MPSSRRRSRERQSDISSERRLRRIQSYRDNHARVQTPRERRKFSRSLLYWRLVNNGHTSTREDVCALPDPALSYYPLEQGQFRLLEISASAKPRLITASVQDSEGTYEAVSYCWGSQSNRYLYSVDGQSTLVGSNLDDFLDELHRRKFRGRLWIDALCINQQDSLEKDRQIPLMAQIYKQSSRVIVWLGPHAEEDCTRLADDLSKLSGWSAKIDGRARDYSVKLRTQRMLLHPNFVEIFRLPWFSRQWILQEAVFAKGLDVWLGSFSIPWTSLAHAGRLLRQPHFDPAKKAQHEWNSEAFHALCQLRRSRDTKHRTTQDILFASAGREAGDPNDHVYALLGLFSSSEIQQRLTGWVDSNRSFRTTFVEFAKIISAEEGIEPILRAASIEKSSTLPSWCPDFANLRNDLLSVSARGPCPTRSWADCRASMFWADSKNRATATDNDHLHIIGAEIDVVSHIVHPPAKTELSRDPFRALLTWITQCMALSSSEDSIKALETASTMAAYRDMCQLLEKDIGIRSAWRTLCIEMRGNATHDSGEPQSNMIMDHEAFLASWLYIKTWTDHKWWRDAPIPDDVTQRILTFAKNGNIFFKTETGRLGLGPSATRLCDRVCRLSGMEAVCLLRERSPSSISGRPVVERLQSCVTRTWRYCGVAHLEAEGPVEALSNPVEEYILA